MAKFSFPNDFCSSSFACSYPILFFWQQTLVEDIESSFQDSLVSAKLRTVIQRANLLSLTTCLVEEVFIFDSGRFHLTFIPTWLRNRKSYPGTYQVLPRSRWRDCRLLQSVLPFEAYCFTNDIHPHLQALLLSCNMYSFALISFFCLRAGYIYFFPAVLSSSFLTFIRWITSSSPPFHHTYPFSGADNSNEQLWDSWITIGFLIDQSVKRFRNIESLSFLFHSSIGCNASSCVYPSVSSIKIIFLWCMMTP